MHRQYRVDADQLPSGAFWLYWFRFVIATKTFHAKLGALSAHIVSVYAAQGGKCEIEP